MSVRRGDKPAPLPEPEQRVHDALIIDNREAEAQLRLIVLRLRTATKRYEERVYGPTREADPG